eukprot:TRINITY_DN56654_c0_g1_i1.p1 TRINITY_DN56654_c0_g1~~TRINITY_DN56654_c0_g1_i1.p1  ORF type:complete len:514 (+),score=93.07 TRINITY_DN56654_c0_g1_i1:88-1542(+)
MPRAAKVPFRVAPNGRAHRYQAFEVLCGAEAAAAAWEAAPAASPRDFASRNARALRNGQVLLRLRRAGREEQALRFFDLLSLDCIDAVLYPSAIAAAGACALTLRATELLSELPQLHVPPDAAAPSQMAALSACSTGGWRSRALELFAELRSRMKPGLPEWAAALHAARGADGLALFDGMREALGQDALDAPIYIAAIACCREALLPERAVALAREMRRQSLGTAEGCSAAIKACTHSTQLRMALDLLSEFRREGHEMGVVEATALMQAYGEGGKAGGAYSVLTELRARGQTPDEISYITLISASARAQLWARALGLYQEMLHDVSPPPSEAAAAALAGAVGAGAVSAELAVGMLGDLRRRGTLPSPAVYGAAVCAYAAASKAQGALQLLQQMQANGLEPRTKALASVAHACHQAGLVAEGDALADFYRGQPTEMRVAPMLAAFRAAGRPERVAAAAGARKPPRVPGAGSAVGGADPAQSLPGK